MPAKMDAKLESAQSAAGALSAQPVVRPLSMLASCRRQQAEPAAWPAPGCTTLHKGRPLTYATLFACCAVRRLHALENPRVLGQEEEHEDGEETEDGRERPASQP